MLDKWDKMFKECTSDIEREKVTNEWLRLNDPYYLDDSNNKREKITYPYFTPAIKKRVQHNEVPESSLNVEGTIEAKRKGMAENKVI